MLNLIHYYLPCNPASIYLNITNKCLNDCLFCIKRKGNVFFGSDLFLKAKEPSSSEIIDSLLALPDWSVFKEIVFCGMGEPLLRYDCVLEVCKVIKKQGRDIKVRMDTSGLFWSEAKRLDILDWIDILSVSLNAENAEKYEELCKPKISNAYAVLMDFLEAIKKARYNYIKYGKKFPEVRLSIVDTSEEDYIPESGRKGYGQNEFPVPDIEKCREISDSFGWALICKKLFRDSTDKKWNDK